MNDIKKQIMRTSQTLFVQYGIRSVSIDDICKKLGISKKTFYIYFKQKEDLISTVLTQHRESVEARLNRCVKTGNAIDNIVAVLHQMKSIVQEQRRNPALVYELQKYYPAVLERHRSLCEQKLTEAFAQNLRKGIAEGFYRKEIDIELLCILFSSRHTHGIVSTVAKNAKGTNTQTVINFFSTMLACYVMADKGWKYLEEKGIKQVSFCDKEEPSSCDNDKQKQQ